MNFYENGDLIIFPVYKGEKVVNETKMWKF